MSVQENKAVARGWNEMAWKADVDDFGQVLHQHCIAHNSVSEGLWATSVDGLEAAKKRFGEQRERREVHVMIEDMFGEDDKLAIRMSHVVDGKPYSAGIVIYRFEGGKIVEDWFCSRQLKP